MGISQPAWLFPRLRLGRAASPPRSPTRHLGRRSQRQDSVQRRSGSHSPGRSRGVLGTQGDFLRACSQTGKGMIESFESPRRSINSCSRTSDAAALQLQQISLQNPRHNSAIGVDSPISQTFSCRRSSKKPHATPPDAHNHHLWAACRLLLPVCPQNSNLNRVQPA